MRTIKLGNYVYDKLSRSGKSAAEVAEAAGISRGHMSRIVHGRSAPSASVMVNLAAALGVSLKTLQKYDDRPGGAPPARRRAK